MRDTRKLKLGDIPLIFYLFAKVSVGVARRRHCLINHGCFLAKKSHNLSCLILNLTLTGRVKYPLQNSPTNSAVLVLAWLAIYYLSLDFLNHTYAYLKFL